MRQAKRPSRRTVRPTVLGLLLLASAVITVFGLAGCGCGEEEVASPAGQIDIAKNTSVKAGILAIQTGIQAYIATTQSVPPAATKDVLGTFVEPWPQNPWTKTDMVEGTEPGDFTYTPGAGTSYTLAGHLSGGGEFVRP